MVGWPGAVLSADDRHTMRPNSKLHNRKHLKQRRRALRNHATTAEAVLWRMLQKSRLHGRKFRRQHSIGPYIVDFYCPSEQLVVELDGAVHDDPARRDYDDRRNRYLVQQGLKVVRFENHIVLAQPKIVLAGIARHFENPDTP